MQYLDKLELIELLSEMKKLLPPVEERKFLTHHYGQLEKRIEDAIKQLQDSDYQYMAGVKRKLMDLHLQGKISPEDFTDFLFHLKMSKCH